MRLTTQMYVSVLFLLSMPSYSEAACNIAASAGKIRYHTDHLDYCDGNNWYTMGRTASAGACTDLGKISLNSSALEICDGADWHALDNGSTGGGACTVNGKIRYSLGTNKVELCDGSEWKNPKRSKELAGCNIIFDPGSCDGTPGCEWDGGGFSCNECICDMP